MHWVIIHLSFCVLSCHAYRWPNTTDLDRIEEILPAISKLRHIDDPPREYAKGRDDAIREFMLTFTKNEFGHLDEALDKFGKVSPRFRDAFAPIAEYIRDGYRKLNTKRAKDMVLALPGLALSEEAKRKDDGAMFEIIEEKVLALPDDSRTELIASYKEFFQILKERKRAIGKNFLLDKYVESYTKNSMSSMMMISFTTILFA